MTIDLIHVTKYHKEYHREEPVLNRRGARRKTGYVVFAYGMPAWFKKKSDAKKHISEMQS